MSKLKKPIMHFKVPMDKMNHLSIRPDELKKFADILNKKFGEDYEILFSPFDMYVSDSKGKVIQTTLEEYTLKEFLDKYDIKKEENTDAN